MATSLRGRDLDLVRIVEKLPEVFTEREFPVLPPGLIARAMEEPEYVVAVPDPKVFVDHSRLVLEEDILVSAEQADSEIDELREFVFCQGLRVRHSRSKDPGDLLIPANDGSHLSECGSSQVIGLRVRGLRAFLDLNRYVNGRECDEDRGKDPCDCGYGIPVHFDLLQGPALGLRLPAPRSFCRTAVSFSLWPGVYNISFPYEQPTLVVSGTTHKVFWVPDPVAHKPARAHRLGQGIE